jgi:hypothetical protein
MVLSLATVPIVMVSAEAFGDDSSVAVFVWVMFLAASRLGLEAGKMCTVKGGLLPRLGLPVVEKDPSEATLTAWVNTSAGVVVES